MASDKELLAEHPLFSKLSGQIVWYLFEERGYAPEHIDGFMQRFETLKAETAALMRSVQDPANQGGMLVFETQTQEAPICAQCRRLDGAALALEAVDLVSWLPPFSLGCRVRAKVLAASLCSERTAAAPSLRPTHRLVCDEEWIFQRFWPLSG